MRPTANVSRRQTPTLLPRTAWAVLRTLRARPEPSPGSSVSALPPGLLLQHTPGHPRMSGTHEQLRLTGDWMLSQGDGASLGLSAVLCAGGDLIYLFSASPFVPGARRAQALPKTVQELLLFEPVVPLRYTHEGFQALQPSEWSDMSAERDSYVGLNTLSSAQESVVSAEGDALDDFADSLSSGLREDIPDLDCQSLRSSASPLAGLDGSDGDSDPNDVHDPA